MTNILVIDNDPEITTMLEKELSSDTHRVQIARNGQDGLKLLRMQKFDVVITDISLQELDSFMVIWEVNGMQPRPRVIAMTGSTGQINQEYLSRAAKALRVQCLLYKPFSIDELVEAVFLKEGLRVES